MRESHPSPHYRAAPKIGAKLRACHLAARGALYGFARALVRDARLQPSPYGRLRATDGATKRGLALGDFNCALQCAGARLVVSFVHNQTLPGFRLAAMRESVRVQMQPCTQAALN